MNENHDDKGRFAAGSGQGTHAQVHQDLHAETVAKPLDQAAHEIAYGYQGRTGTRNVRRGPGDD